MIAKDGGVILLPLPKLALVIAGNFSADEESADPGIRVFDTFHLKNT